MSAMFRMAAAALAAATATACAGEFQTACRTKSDAAEKAGSMTVPGREGWLFLARELRHLGVGCFWGPEAIKVSRADKPENADPLPAILDFSAQMKRAGIELIVLPVPAKAAVYPDKLDALFPPTPRLDEADLQFANVLREHGVTVIDLAGDFLARRDEKEGAVFCRTDSHWSGRACVLAAREIARTVKDRPWLKNAPKQEFRTRTNDVTVTGDLLNGQAGDKPLPEVLTLRTVTTPVGDPVEPARESPIVLLGDSHCLIFHSGGDMLAAGAGLADQLAAELGLAVDLVGVRGSGATPARVNLLRRARADAGYLATKKLVIWCFTVREFTESSGWARVPVVP